MSAGLCAGGVVGALFAANHLFNHGPPGVWPRGTIGYYLGVILPFGTIVPAWAIGRLARDAPGRRRLGLPPSARDGTRAVLAFILGVVAASFAIGPRVLLGSIGVPRLAASFAALLMASIAEVLVFVGVLLVVVEGALAPGEAGPIRRAGAALGGLAVSAVAFGLFHFTYPAPWNSWETVRMLTIVWVVVGGLFVVTRSLPAAIAFNNMMAVIGFVRHDLSPPAPAVLGLALALTSATVVAGLVGSSARSAPRLQVDRSGVGPGA